MQDKLKTVDNFDREKTKQIFQCQRWNFKGVLVKKNYPSKIIIINEILQII